MPSFITSDNGVSSGSAGLKTTAASDGALALQTTTAGGTATTAVTLDTSQNVLVGMASYGVTNAGVSLSPTASSSFYVAGGTAVTIGRGTSDGTAVQFNRSGTNVGTIGVATTGINMTGVNGVTFTATQTASSDANTLDDYEEGTWTGSISTGSGAGGTWSSVSGVYTKIGRSVSVSGQITGTSMTLTGQTAYRLISGLPFSCQQVVSGVFITSNIGTGGTAGAVYVSGSQFFLYAVNNANANNDFEFAFVYNA